MKKKLISLCIITSMVICNSMTVLAADTWTGNTYTQGGGTDSSTTTNGTDSGTKTITGTFTKDWIISKVIGLFAVSGLFFLIAFVTQGRAMGGGDIKLMAAVGFVLGWKAVIISLFMSAILGVLFSVGRKIFAKKEMKGVIPFGPFLAMGSAICAFIGEWIFDAYLNLFL